MNTEFRLPRLVREQAQARARALRLRPSEAESRLWQELRRTGLGFRRQQAVGPYVVAFYSARLALALVVEEAPLREDFREVELARHGVRLLRLSPRDVVADVASCVVRLRDELRAA